MKKITLILLIILLVLSLCSCANSRYDEIIDTAQSGKTPPTLDIQYNHKDNSIHWNKISDVDKYKIQINEYYKETTGNQVYFKEDLAKGIYAVTVTPKGYKSTTTLITVDVEAQNSYLDTGLFISAIIILSLALAGAVTLILKLKKINTFSNNIPEETTENKTNLLLKDAEDKILQLSEENEKLKQKNTETNTTLEIFFNENQSLKEKAETAIQEKEAIAKVKSEKETIISELSQENNILTKQLENLKKSKTNSSKKDKSKDFRKEHDANYRCNDSHYVRSKSEREIDNFFFNNDIFHIYEAKYEDPITKKELYPDFYLPKYKLYIEYFGMDNNEYNKKREEKIKIYKSNPNIKFEIIDFSDDFNLTEKLQQICRNYSIPVKY